MGMTQKNSFYEFLFPIVYPAPAAQLPGLISIMGARFFQLLRLVYICMNLSDILRCPTQKYLALFQLKVSLTESALSVGIGIWLCDCLFKPGLNPMETSLKKLFHLVSSKTLPVELERQFSRLLCGKESPQGLFFSAAHLLQSKEERILSSTFCFGSKRSYLRALTFLKFLAFDARKTNQGVSFPKLAKD